MSTSPADERPAVRRLSKEARREQLLDSAAELLRRGGSDALTMEAMGLEAGASKTLGYAYFANIEDVITALREREMGHLNQRVAEAAAAYDHFDDRLAATFRAYFDVVAERGVLLGEIEGAVRARRLSALAEGTNDFIAWLAGLIDDEFGVGRRRATWYAAIIGSLANTHGWIWKPSRYSRERIEAQAIAFALGGLRAAIAAEQG
jgi:AcrR family transcriptional regulator